jgi:hypothetical protein
MRRFLLLTAALLGVAGAVAVTNEAGAYRSCTTTCYGNSCTTSCF